MKKTVLFTALFCILYGASSCSDENDEVASSNVDNTLAQPILSKKDAMSQFAGILSRAVQKNEYLRAFIKKEAQFRIDNGADVVYQLVKDKKIGNATFKQIMEQYSDSPNQIDMIEDCVPTLDIHLPEYGDLTAEKLDVTDNECPILFENKLYLNGSVQDSLAEGEIPGFMTMVVCENSRIRPIVSPTRAAHSDMLGGKFEYVDAAFNPNKVNASAFTRSVDFDVPNPKYDEGISSIPKSDVDPEVLRAFQRASKDNLAATRYLLYYNLNNSEDTPTKLRTDIHDCIWRFKIDGNSFKNLQDVAEGLNIRHPLFYGNVTHMKTPLSREEVIKHILTGSAFCFLFEYETAIRNGQVQIGQMRIFATPEKVFNLGINKYRRHPTMFRHTKYTYTINFSDIKPKWFYPLENSNDTRFANWDISKDPITKKITAYLINPDEGDTATIANTYSVTKVKGAELGANISATLAKVITLGINGKLNSSTTTVQSVSAQYSLGAKNMKLGEVDIDYFKDYPIESFDGNDRVIPMRKGAGLIKMSIIPISKKFYTINRFK